jgi:hypothetical protein
LFCHDADVPDSILRPRQDKASPHPAAATGAEHTILSDMAILSDLLSIYQTRAILCLLVADMDLMCPQPRNADTRAHNGSNKFGDGGQDPERPGLRIFYFFDVAAW